MKLFIYLFNLCIYFFVKCIMQLEAIFQSYDLKFKIKPYSFITLTESQESNALTKQFFFLIGTHLYHNLTLYLHVQQKKCQVHLLPTSTFKILFAFIPLEGKVPILHTDLSKFLQGKDISWYNNLQMMQNIKTCQILHFDIWTSLLELRQCYETYYSDESDLLHHFPTLPIYVHTYYLPVSKIKYQF